MSTTISKLHAIARALVATGRPVFPCVANAKTPACENGFKDATLDLGQIDEWWTADPNYNPAYCPHEVGECVVDTDGPEGAASWEALKREVEVPETLEVETPRGGMHYHFEGELPASVGGEKTKRCLGVHIDTRGVGSYVLAPGAIVGGRPYRIKTNRPLAPVPAEFQIRLKRHVREISQQAVDDDRPVNVGRAIGYLKQCVADDRVAKINHGGDDLTFEVCCELRGLGLSEGVALQLLLDHWYPHCRPNDVTEWVEFKLRNAYEYGQNSTGVWATEPAAAKNVFVEAVRALVLDQAEEDFSRFYPPSVANPDFDTDDAPSDLSTYRAEQQAYKTPMLVRDWMQWGIYTALSGAGGTHKSRFLLQVALTLLFRRNVFQPTLPIPDVDRSVRVDHVEYLNAENEIGEMKKRVFEMDTAMNLPPKPPEGTSLKIWELKKSRRRLLTIVERPDDGQHVRLTSYGKRMMLRWEKIAASGKKSVLIFDGLFNLVRFEGATKVDDNAVGMLVETLEHWAAIFNATILAPIQPSRAGRKEGHTGYSAVFEDRPRQLLTIGKLEPKGKGQSVPLGYALTNYKWNDGQHGKAVALEYVNGLLLPIVTEAQP